MNSEIQTFNFRDLSKKYQLILTTALLLFMLSVSFYLIFPDLIEKTLLEEFKESQNSIAELTAENLWVPLLYGSYNHSENDYEKAIYAMLNLNNLTHLFVYDNSGIRVFKYISSDEKMQVQVYHPQNDVADYVEQTHQLYVVNKDVEYEGKKYGKVTLAFSLAGINKSIDSIRLQILIICLFILGLGIFLTFFIAKLISNPLETLLVTFNQISLGNLSERVNITTNEEFGQLAKSFNTMVDNLEETYFELAETNKNMEEKVAQRTMELKEQIDVRTKAEEKLLATNRMVSSIINTCPLPIITLFPDFKIRTASPATTVTFLYEEFELIDKIVPIIYADEVENFINELQGISSANQVKKITIKGCKKNGQLLDLQIAVVAEYAEEDSDKHTGYIMIVDDITERLIIEKSVKESEQKYRSLIEDSIVGIGILKDKNFTFANSALLNIFGYSGIADFLAIPFMEMVHLDYRSKIVELYELIELYELRESDLDIETALPVIEINILCDNGTEKHVELASNILVLDEEYYLQMTFLDITERIIAERKILKLNEELEQRVTERTSQLNKTLIELRGEMNRRMKLSSELQFKSEILERTTSLCIVWNVDGECVYISPWSELVMGWAASNILANGIWKNLNPQAVDGKTFSKESIGELVRGDKQLVSQHYTVRMVTSTGETKYFNLMDSIGLNNTLITAGTEITQQIIGQQELKVVSEKLAQSLENEKELNELKTRFISMVSHEFRTPLTVIMSCTSVIQQAIEKSRKDIAEQYLDKVAKSVNTMNDLMEDVLVIGNAELKQIKNLVEINFVDFVRNALDEIQESYSFSCQAILHANKDIQHFYSDEKSLKHIVYNLITNAMKYTINKENVVITIDAIDDDVLFTVTDKGIGIPEEDLKTLFTNFHRARNVGKIAGTGLGLHIVKKSVENLLGTIEVNSKVNEGSTFTVTLPKDIRQLM